MFGKGRLSKKITWKDGRRLKNGVSYLKGQCVRFSCIYGGKADGKKKKSRKWTAKTPHNSLRAAVASEQQSKIQSIWLLSSLVNESRAAVTHKSSPRVFGSRLHTRANRCVQVTLRQTENASDQRPNAFKDGCWKIQRREFQRLQLHNWNFKKKNSNAIIVQWSKQTPTPRFKPMSRCVSRWTLEDSISGVSAMQLHSWISQQNWRYTADSLVMPHIEKCFVKKGTKKKKKLFKKKCSKEPRAVQMQLKNEKCTVGSEKLRLSSRATHTDGTAVPRGYCSGPSGVWERLQNKHSWEGGGGTVVI